MLRPIQLAFLSLSAFAIVGVWGPFALDGGFDELDAVVARHPSTGIPGLRHYPELDRGLMSIVAFNLCAVNSAAYLFMVQFLANVAAIPVILYTEDSRAASGSWIRYSTIWGILSQLCTSAVVYPLYAISFIRRSSDKPSLTGRLLPNWVLVSSMAIGYSIPVALTLKVLHSNLNLQIWGILAFTAYPICMMLTIRIVQAFASYIPFTNQSQHRSSPKWRYVVAGGAGLLGHFWYLATMLGLSAGHTSSLEEGTTELDRRTYLVLRFLQVDYAITFGAMLLLAWHEMTLRRILPAWQALGGIIIGWILIGPGATLAAAWALREQFSETPEVRKKE